MELTISQALQKAIEAHKAGQLQEADRVYTAILKAQPKNPDVNHNMGVLAVSVDKVQEALPFFKTALETNPNKVQFWLSYIDALIKLDRLPDAKAAFDQCKGNVAKGDGFAKLEQRLNQLNKVPAGPVDNKNELEQSQSNNLDTVKLDQALKLAKKKSKKSSSKEAKKIYQDILAKFPKNKRAIDGIKALSGGTIGKTTKVQDPPQDQLKPLINHYNQGQFQEALKQASQLLEQFPKSIILYNICGAANSGLGQLESAIGSFKKALSIKPDYADAYNNMGITLQEHGKLDEAIESYKKALSFKPNYAEAYYNMGNTLKDQGKLKETIQSYKKALSIKSDYANAYNNMGIVLKDQGKLDEAIEAYKKALSINPGYPEAYNNMGVILKEHGNLDEAIYVS